MYSIPYAIYLITHFSLRADLTSYAPFTYDAFENYVYSENVVEQDQTSKRLEQ